jgi:transposase
MQEIGVAVEEVVRPDRAARRRNGKSDPADAIAAARAVMSGLAGITPKTDGVPETIRVLHSCRKSLVKQRTQTINHLRAVIDTAPEQVRAELVELAIEHIAKTAEAWETIGELRSPADTAQFVIRELVDRWHDLNRAIGRLDDRLETAVHIAAPEGLLNKVGVGPDVAATIITAMGANPERVTTEKGFAALAGVNPIDASSGRNQRHRLNRGGNRELNSALWRIVLVRLRYDPATRDYMTRRITEGRTKREIIRCLKRHVAREIWKTFQPPKPQIST